MEYNFQFPVFLIPKGTRPSFCKDESKLIITNSLAIKNSFFNDALVVDAALYLYKINYAKKIKGVGFFAGFNIFLNQTIEVEFDIEKQERISLNTFKNIILKREYFINMISGEAILHQLSNAESIEKIIEIYSDITKPF